MPWLEKLLKESTREERATIFLKVLELLAEVKIDRTKNQTWQGLLQKWRKAECQRRWLSRKR